MGSQHGTPAKTTETTRQSRTRKVAQPSVQNNIPVHPLLQLQRQIGNRAVSHLIQTKLKVGKPDDRYEREAERVADTVMRMTIPQVLQPPTTEAIQTKPQVGTITPLAQRQADEEEEPEEMAQSLQRQMAEEEEEEPGATAQTLQRKMDEDEEEEEPTATAQTLQRQVDEEEEVQVKEVPRQTPTVTPALETQIQSLRGTGKPLPDSTRTFFEPRFGYDFGGVRVHADASAAGAASDLNAQAFTVGQDIFFGSGRYEPDTTSGRRLLAHELTHTVQQQPGRTMASRSTVQRRHTSDRGSLVPRRQMKAATLGNGAEAGVSGATMVPPPAGLRTPGTGGTAPGATGEIAFAPRVREPAPPSETPSPASATPQAAPSPELKASAPATPALVAAAAGPAEATSAESTEMEAALVEESTEATAEEAPAEAAKDKATQKVPAKGEGKEAAGEQAPASPATDPGFQAVVKRIKGVAKRQRCHAPASAKSQEAQAASKPDPTSEVASKAQVNQVEAMEQAETPAFDAAAFKAALMGRIAEIAPKTLEEADDFKKDNKLEAVKQETTATVKEEQTASQAPLKEKSEETPDTSGIEPKLVTDLPPADPGKKPAKIDARKAAPKAKQPSQVEAPLAENSRKLDQQTAEVDPPLTDEFLIKSKEPEFQTALEAKKEAQADAAEAPQAYRQFEQDQLSQAEAKAVATAQQQTQAMYTDRTKQFGQVESQQVNAKSKDEQAREKVASDIQKIYETAKTNVETILSDLDTKVEQVFDTGATAATQAFEDYVDREMRAYKRRRYDRLGGSVLWAKDKLLGMPDEVNEFYTEGRRRFIEDMDAVIDNVVTIVATGLTDAKTEIAKGKKEIQDYVAKLPEDLQKVGQDAATNIESQFKDLEESVNDKQGELIDTLAQKYQENLQAVDARIEELKAANQGLVDKAINAVASVIQTIIKLKNLLLSVLAKVAKVVTDIISDPIGFLGNLIKGLTQGFQNFVGNILTHLQTGLIGWLTGALGPTGITIPENLFSLPGIFSLVMQVLGLTWDYIRAKAVKMFGEPVVAAMEKGAEIFQVLRTGGPAGLWQYVKDEFTDLKEMVIEQIKSMVITEVIEAGVKWILGLLSPAGALVKAAMAIYEIVTFFINRAAQVFELINAVIDAVAAIAKGAVGAAAQLVENALAKAVPIVIGFLASLLGISGLAKKVQKIIQRIRKRIDKAITKLLMKAKKFVAGKLLGKGKDSKTKDKKDQPELEVKVEKSLSMAGKGHTIYAKVQRGKLVIEIASGRLQELKGAVASAIPVAREKGKDKLEKDLDWTYSGLKAIEEDLNAVPFFPKEKRGQAEAELLRAISNMAAELERIGRKHGIPSLIDLGHPSKYVKDKEIRQKYRRKKFRPLFYGDWNSKAKSHRRSELAALKIEAKDPKWNKDPNFGNPKAFVCKDKHSGWTPYLALDVPGNVALDHITEVSRHWNQGGGGHNQDQSKREAWYNTTSNLQVIDKRQNSKKSGPPIDYQVGKDFRGPDE